MPPVSAECSDHPTLSLVVRIKHLNDQSQPCRIFNPSTGSAREEDIARGSRLSILYPGLIL